MFFWIYDIPTWALVPLSVPGPVEILDLRNGRFATEGQEVIARTAGLSYTTGRITRGILGYLASGEHRMRVFEGTGRLVVCWAPFWRHRFASRAGQDETCSGCV